MIPNKLREDLSIRKFFIEELRRNGANESYTYGRVGSRSARVSFKERGIFFEDGAEICSNVTPVGSYWNRNGVPCGVFMVTRGFATETQNHLFTIPVQAPTITSEDLRGKATKHLVDQGVHCCGDMERVLVALASWAYGQWCPPHETPSGPINDPLHMAERIFSVAGICSVYVHGVGLKSFPGNGGQTKDPICRFENHGPKIRCEIARKWADDPGEDFEDTGFVRTGKAHLFGLQGREVEHSMSMKSVKDFLKNVLRICDMTRKAKESQDE